MTLYQQRKARYCFEFMFLISIKDLYKGRNDQSEKMQEESKVREEKGKSPKEMKKSKDLKIHFIIHDLYSKDFESLDARNRFAKSILNEF